ncbi:MAG: HAD family hydrolase [Xanthomonadaceae bacterium]|nr:HAD family hydrolase [Xanthomonadaceae bacterium]
MNTALLRSPYLDPAVEVLLAQASLPRRALFLDRDGVINVNHGYVHTPERTDWLPGIFELVVQAHVAGWLPIVVTNQAGIGRGYYDEAAFLDYTAWVHAQFAQRGAPLLATYWCPHHPEHGLGDYKVMCPCRKPAAGMLLAAMARFALDPARSLLLGDKPGDVEAASAAGVRGQLVTVANGDPLPTLPV